MPFLRPENIVYTKDVPHQHTTGDAMGPSHQSEQLRSLVLPGGHHEKKRSKFWLSQFLFYFWYQGYFYDTKHSHIDTDLFFETNFCDCDTETIKRRDIRDQDVTLCVTSITDKKLNSFQWAPSPFVTSMVVVVMVVFTLAPLVCSLCFHFYTRYAKVNQECSLKVP